MRFAGLVTSLLCFFWATAASAEVLAVCAEPGTTSGSYAGAPVFTSGLGAGDSQLALSRDAQGFDILLHWGEQNQHSLRSDGAEIMGMQLGADLIHLVVARSDGRSLEHFLFSLDDALRGELVWSASGDARDDDTVTLQSSCVRPK